MLLEPAIDARCTSRSLSDASALQPALTYLANTLAGGDREIPYSTVTAIDFDSQPPLGPFVGQDGKPLRAAGRRRDRAQSLGRRPAARQAGRHRSA